MNFNSNFFLIFILSISFFYSFDFEFQISKIMKDSVDYDSLNIEELSLAYSTNPDFLFMEALIDFDGEKSLNKFKDFYNKNQSYKYADYVVFEIGSFYYSKGYYLESGKWYKKIPMYYHSSKLLNESIDMFYNTLKISGSKDSINYYNNIFSKLYPKLENENSNSTEIVDKIYETQYTIQIGAFEEYAGAESRMYLLNSQGFAVRIEEIKIDNKTLFSVREGTYSTKKSANKIILRIKARTGLDCMVIEL